MYSFAPSSFPALRPLGDASVLVEFGDGISTELNGRVAAFERVIRKSVIPGVLETAPTIKSVVIRFDPLEISFEHLSATLRGLLDQHTDLSNIEQVSRRVWNVPVCYDQALAPDLAEMANALNLDIPEVIRLHSVNVQQVLMIGFAPGFLYSGLLPDTLHVPRRTSITPEIPPGAVICAVGQTCIAATTMPTGWYEIGRSPLRNFHPDRDPAVLITAGDTISFSAIGKAEFEAIEAARDAGNWQPECDLA